MSLERFAAALTAVALLAGCTGESDPDRTAVIQYHGEEPGSESSSFLCDSTSKNVKMVVTFKGDVGKSFRVALRDPDGSERVNETFNLPGPAEETRSFDFPSFPGDWHLRVDRTPPFKGNVNVRATCE